MSDLVERVADAIATVEMGEGDLNDRARAAIAEVRRFDVERGPSDAEIEVAASVVYRRMEEQAFASGAVSFFTEWKDANREIHRHYRAIVTDFINAAAKVRAEEVT